MAIQELNLATKELQEQILNKPSGGRRVFTASGVFTVPTDVFEIFVTGCGGGGDRGAGANSVVGELVTMAGGSAAGAGTEKRGAGAGGGGGIGSNGSNRGGAGGAGGGAGAAAGGAGGAGGGGGTSGGGGGGGGGGSYGAGGAGGGGGADGGAGGAGGIGGGAGGDGGASKYSGKDGGGGGKLILGKPFSVTPHQSINITVGEGNGKGGDGIVIIEWM